MPAHALASNSLQSALHEYELVNGLMICEFLHNVDRAAPKSAVWPTHGGAGGRTRSTSPSKGALFTAGQDCSTAERPALWALSWMPLPANQRSPIDHYDSPDEYALERKFNFKSTILEILFSTISSNKPILVSAATNLIT